MYPRYIGPVIKTALSDTPVVCLLSPRQVGKTALVQQLVPQTPCISFNDHNLVAAAKNDPVGFVLGLAYSVILDEVQQKKKYHDQAINTIICS